MRVRVSEFYVEGEPNSFGQRPRYVVYRHGAHFRCAPCRSISCEHVAAVRKEFPHEEAKS